MKYYLKHASKHTHRHVELQISEGYGTSHVDLGNRIAELFIIPTTDFSINFIYKSGEVKV